MDQLAKISLKGFKSIYDLTDLELNQRNILIGANGAGKSNFISFFKLLNWMTAGSGNLQFHIGECGGGNALLYDGSQITKHIEFNLVFKTSQGINEYNSILSHASPDTLIFVDEKYRYSGYDIKWDADWTNLGSGHRESKLIDDARDSANKTARFILGLLRRCIVHQFHNTSETARIRQKWVIEDNRYLKEDGANLAPFLMRMRDEDEKYYYRIVETIRLITPYFSDFYFNPVGGRVMLQWTENGTDMVFGAHQASDGTLRTTALVSLLLQPEANFPAVLVLDEPELGLHPYSINIIAGLIRSASEHTQVVLATQSTAFIDCFEPEDIIVVDRPGRKSTFARLAPKDLKEWLEDYTLSELWEKNVIGGRPSS